jgi:hypothetical protein
LFYSYSLLQLQHPRPYPLKQAAVKKCLIMKYPAILLMLVIAGTTSKNTMVVSALQAEDLEGLGGICQQKEVSCVADDSNSSPDGSVIVIASDEDSGAGVRRLRGLASSLEQEDTQDVDHCPPPYCPSAYGDDVGEPEYNIHDYEEENAIPLSLIGGDIEDEFLYEPWNDDDDEDADQDLRNRNLLSRIASLRRIDAESSIDHGAESKEQQARDYQSRFLMETHDDMPKFVSSSCNKDVTLAETTCTPWDNFLLSSGQDPLVQEIHISCGTCVSLTDLPSGTTDINLPHGLNVVGRLTMPAVRQDSEADLTITTSHVLVQGVFEVTPPQVPLLATSTTGPRTSFVLTTSTDDVVTFVPDSATNNNVACRTWPPEHRPLAPWEPSRSPWPEEGSTFKPFIPPVPRLSN